jgi:hypothetical protein
LLGDKTAYSKKSDFVIKAIKYFIIFKSTLALFLQIPVLLTDDAWDMLSLFFNNYLVADFVKNLLAPPCFIIQTVTGLFLLSLIVPFFFEIAKDEELYDYIKTKINRELLNNHFFVTKQNLHSAFFLFMLGCLFFTDFLLDNINFLPDFMICAFLIPGIFIVRKNNPDLKIKKLTAFLAANSFISIIAYVSGMLYRISAAKAFTGENIFYLQIFRFLSAVSYQVSVVFFFLIFVEFYFFISDLRRFHIEFSVRYLNRYLASSEKNYDKNKNKIFWAAAAACCFKTLSIVLPQSGIVIFFHLLILSVFVFFAVKGLYQTRESIYSLYKIKDE